MKLERNYAEVSLSQLNTNFDLFRSYVEPNVTVLAVVKANAYGHGAVEVAKSLERHGCTFFAVASLEEAIELREGGITKNILIFGKTNPENGHLLTNYDLIQTVHSLDYATELNHRQTPIRTHIKIDTGMSRMGIYCHDFKDLDQTKDQIKKIIDLPYLHNEGIFTHFADTDNHDPSFTRIQFCVFRALLLQLEELHIPTGLRHACNSSATLRFKEMHLDMVRIGIALYGYPQVSTSLDLKPAMQLYGEVISIRNIKKGDTVSYVRRYLSNGDKRVATIAIGYADGYLRGSSNNDYFLFKGQMIPQIGTICMDACMGDVTDIDIQVGDFVNLFGIQKTAHVLAGNNHTIDYEVLTSITNRVKRVYVK